MYVLQISNLWAGMESRMTKISPIAAALVDSMLNKQHRAVKSVNGKTVRNALKPEAAWNVKQLSVCSISMERSVVPNTATATTITSMVSENKSLLTVNVNTSKTVEITTTPI